MSLFPWRWICEFCYRLAFTQRLPAGWDFVWQAAVCPTCQQDVAHYGGYLRVPGGSFADRPDPRGTYHAHLEAAVSGRGGE